MDVLIDKWFGGELVEKEARFLNYDLVEEFIADAHLDWSVAPVTAKVVCDFQSLLSDLPDRKFAFLVCHSGYIPEIYAADSAAETLYSKLIEVIVQQWALRIGFDRSVLPTQKSSKEDVTIQDADSVIVCDAKSYRLGRSQKAPNVKDALKQGDIRKWLRAYPEGQQLGGLVTFPSQHDWTSGSDFYMYLTDYTSPIVMLFYEHLSFLLLNNVDRGLLKKIYRSHRSLFPKAYSRIEKNRSVYFEILDRELIGRSGSEPQEFFELSDFISREKATYSLGKLHQHLRESRLEIENNIERTMSKKDLVRELADARFNSLNSNFLRQAVNIELFRKLLK